MDHSASNSEASSQEAAQTARLLVYERTGWWAALLGRELAGAGVSLVQTRTLTDCWQELEQSPTSFLVLELTLQNARELLWRIAAMEHRFPGARAAVVADRWLAEYQWVFRAAGAVWFCCSPRQITTLAAVACRHLAQAPPPRQSFAQRIWASLPWQRFAHRQ